MIDNYKLICTKTILRSYLYSNYNGSFSEWNRICTIFGKNVTDCLSKDMIISIPMDGYRFIILQASKDKNKHTDELMYKFIEFPNFDYEDIYIIVDSRDELKGVNLFKTVLSIISLFDSTKTNHDNIIGARINVILALTSLAATGEKYPEDIPNEDIKDITSFVFKLKVRNTNDPFNYGYQNVLQEFDLKKFYSRLIKNYSFHTMDFINIYKIFMECERETKVESYDGDGEN